MVTDGQPEGPRENIMPLPLIVGCRGIKIDGIEKNLAVPLRGISLIVIQCIPKKTRQV